MVGDHSHTFWDQPRNTDVLERLEGRNGEKLTFPWILDCSCWKKHLDANDQHYLMHILLRRARTCLSIYMYLYVMAKRVYILYKRRWKLVT